jgi:RNA-directed DNA polymerase
VRFPPPTLLVACCHSRQQAEQVKAQLAGWLAPRGLVFNEDKTKIVHLTEGFDFLGFNVRRYRNGKLLIKPSRAAIKRPRSRLATGMRALRGSNAAAVIAALTPVIRGWAAYYQGAVSSKVFGDLDNYMWKLTYRWAKRSHGGKPKRWVVHRYFGRFNKFRNDRWVFGNRAGRDERGSVPHLIKFAWTPIIRHQLVTGTASPDDPDLTDYWAARRQRSNPRWTATTCACSPGRPDAARSAATRCSPPTSPSPQRNGNGGGSAWSAGRSPPTTSSTRTGTARRTAPEPA